MTKTPNRIKIAGVLYEKIPEKIRVEGKLYVLAGNYWSANRAKGHKKCPKGLHWDFKAKKCLKPTPPHAVGTRVKLKHHIWGPVRGMSGIYSHPLQSIKHKKGTGGTVQGFKVVKQKLPATTGPLHHYKYKVKLDSGHTVNLHEHHLKTFWMPPATCTGVCAALRKNSLDL